MSVQSAKDTFYRTLRDRLAALNAERTAVLRGVTRPAVLMLEQELPNAAKMLNCFRLRWTAYSLDPGGALPTVSLDCAIEYATEGTPESGGADRGEVLAALDGELATALTRAPQNAFANIDEGNRSAATGRMWWSDPRFSSVTAAGDQLQRTATVTVLTHVEAGAA